MMQALARFAVRRRWFVVAGWILFIVATQALLAGLGGSDYRDDFKLPGTETQTVSRLLSEAGLDSQNGATGVMVLHARSGAVADYAERVRPALRELCDGGFGIASAVSPYGIVSCGPSASPGATDSAVAAAQLSKDRSIGLVDLNWAEQQPTVAQISGVREALEPLGSADLQVEFTGNAFQALAAETSGVPPEVIGLVAALMILLLVFRTIGATLLPLVSAIAAMGSGLALIGLLSHVMSVASFANQLALLMILGVGVDYALFIVTRHRRNLMRGMSVEDSIVVALNTSGRAVLFAGTTVCIALMGLWALGVSFLYGVSLGTAIGVALTMVASLTLLPALLSFLGLKVLPRGQRRDVRAGDFDLSEHRDFWYRWSHLVERRKLGLGAVAVVLLAILAIPFFSIRLGSSDQGNDPKGSTTRAGYDLIAQGFGPGYNSGLQLVISGPQAADAAFLGRVSQTLAGVADVAPESVRALPVGREIALVTFKSTTSPQDARTTDLVKKLRASVLPPLYAGTDNRVYVYGVTAIFVDFAKVLSAKMPIFFLAVIGLSFLLLMVAFRSLVIPMTAAVMNLLAAAASFGVIVAIFQWGWLSEALGIGGGGPIEAFVPVMFFAILFGLSMDYQVFLVSRMHEEWLHTRDNRRSITVGQGETGGIITAAAIIMIAVFGGFVLGDARVIKLFGIGLASAVFLDAFVVRTVLVPSLMHLLGDSNWHYPKWLDRITPQVSIEAADVAEQNPADPDGNRELAGV
ncbi:MAG TPA: MMPL family transporter [Jatrophihabitans sp.]|jgi:RND superfamily putative drug exporter|uniref:MMPL family transporter n=1 Tax=Jatrophihabitans sp. TaxID=1932789 RepID=UPI002EED5FE0